MYSKDFPYLCAVTDRYLLTDAGKETWHVVVSLEGSGIRYAAGDCVGIVPNNDPKLARRTNEALGGSVELLDFLTNQANITQLNKRIARAFGREDLLNDREALGACTLYDLAKENPLPEEEIRALLPPLLPRFYSIASSQRVVGDEVHLTVRATGVCTDFLCHRVPLNEKAVPLFLQKADTFRLPQDPTTPIIMVGPGTGVAPYRAFLQERHAAGAKGPNWLFFGEWTQKNHFFYQTFFQELKSAGQLRLHTAFSRDQDEKVYVQHRMLEQSAEIWRWLEEGAHFYVCGDAKRMAKDVQAALVQIAQDIGGHNQAGARDYLRHLRRTKRYLADVY